MEAFRRYAVYYAPPPGEFARRAEAWLGWDAATGRAVLQPDLGLPAAEITQAAATYGFHGTIKPPFRLAEGCSRGDLCGALSGLAAGLAPVKLPGLRLADLHGFLALVPDGDAGSLNTLAARVVADLDAFRAPPTAPEIARRRPEALTPRQREMLQAWGYPYVMEEFRFHLTLTDRLPPVLAARVAEVLSAHFAPVLPRPFVIADLCLFGEAADGRFRLLRRFALGGTGERAGGPPA